MEYPTREKFFAQRFHRIMAKLCIAQEVGSLGYAILSVVVSQEDACRYRKAVTYYDSQLMPLLGCKSDSQIVKTRRKLVSSGWLHFEPGRKGVPSSYWVTIPEQFKDVEDTGIGEHVDGIRSIREANEERKRNASGTNEERIENERGTNEEHSLPYTLLPIPSSLCPSETESAKSDAASLAMEFHFLVPGVTKPLLPDLEAHFGAKLVWLRSMGRDETEYIRSCIRSPRRDKSEATSIGKMFLFWQFCEEQSNGREFSGTGARQRNQAAKRSTQAIGSSPMSAGGGRHEGIQPRIASND